MPNPEHMKIFNKGVKVWNEWREKNPGIKPDLSEICLTDVTLNSIYLSETNLSRAYLSEIDLVGSNLIWTDLSSAHINDSILTNVDFEGTNFNDAYIRNTSFKDTDFSGATFHYAKLKNVSFQRANFRTSQFSDIFMNIVHLHHVDLTKAIFDSSILLETMIKSVKGLNLCQYQGPITIDLKTIQKSWPLPIEFLRGCDLPDNYIEILPSILAEGIEYHSCFISYSHKDEEFAKRLYDDLQNKGVRCYYAPEDMKIGDRIRPRIDDAIRIHEKLLLILSENSINSKWVEKEVETAFEKEKDDRTVLFPIRLDESFKETDRAWAADIRRTRHIGDFRKWKDHNKYMNAFDRLLRDLKAGK